MSKPLHYRIGIDLGTNSLGWCCIALDADGNPVRLLPHGLGVRIFPDGRDPQSQQSLAADRRLARQARRRRDRSLRRKRDLLRALVAQGLMPADPTARKVLEALEPYDLRRRALSERLEPHALGRALFHLGQRRGFKSMRVAGEEDNEKGAIDAGIAQLVEEMAATEAVTVGAYLRHRLDAGQPARARPMRTGVKVSYPFYPARRLIEAEFDAIRAAQVPHHPDVSDAGWDEIRRTMFRQRDLKPVKPGRCTLYPEDERAPWALPIAQTFRILHELSNLRWQTDPRQAPCPLDPDQRLKLLRALQAHEGLTFAKIRKTAGLPGGAEINLEDEKRDGLDGDETAAILRGKGKRVRLGSAWDAMPPDRRTALVELWLREQDEEKLTAALQAEFGLDAETARKVVAAPLPQGHCRLGRRALAVIVPLMEGGKSFPEAAAALGLHHSDLRGHMTDRSVLPYYGEACERFVAFGSGEPADRERGDETAFFGRVPNPTVHMALNQLRVVLNAIIAEHGKPTEIVVELARDLKRSARERAEAQKKQAENQRANEARDKIIREYGLEPSGELRTRLKLWEEQGPPHDRPCPYTGQQIGIKQLFSAAVEIDHILPFSRSFDDSLNNRVVCLREANRAKRNKTPFEAFGPGQPRPPGIAPWEEIEAWAKRNRNKGKRWRFEPEAMHRFDAEGGFLGRQLNETRQLSRLARIYLQSLFPDPETQPVGRRNPVRVTSGTLTGLLRAKWGLNGLLGDENRKTRTDHRHHAVDAAVIACIDQATLQKVQTAAGRAEAFEDKVRLLDDLEPPFPTFRDQVAARIHRVAVSHRPEHGLSQPKDGGPLRKGTGRTSGRLHEETAYGIIPPHRRDPAAPDRNRDPEGHTLVYRKGFADLNRNEAARIRDPALRDAVLAALAHLPEKATAKAVREVLDAFALAQTETGGPWAGLRHVRLTKPEKDFIPIHDRRTGLPYKAVVAGENLCVDVVRVPDGKGGVRWEGRGITVFAGNRGGGLPALGPDGVMRLFKGDCVRLAGEDTVYRVVQLEVAGQRVRLAAVHEAGTLQKRHDDPDDGFRWLLIAFDQLRRRGGRKVNVGPTGRVKDPGPHPDSAGAGA
ncbi:type II CRISPR RNA-guided endonuclease Cas9 [Rhodocista pekingensis]|uniref:CRISPR-associated endonuclease Cas9 n=1 Tax=Rhodocista pekingensis TaxID=201185 RepID=A0ABW2KXG5_9PROT